MTMQATGRRYDTGEAVVVDVDGDRIARIRPAAEAADSPLGDASSLPWLAPGLIDLQVNGFGGQEFNDWNLDVPKVVGIGEALDAHGVTGYLATVMTHSYEMLRHAVTTIAAARDASPSAVSRLLGVHLEGPYISPADGPRGAHPAEHVRPPDWDEFQRLQEAARGLIRIVTLSPEYDEAAAFIRKAAASGVVVAIGHTRADTDQLTAAVDAGARMSTHLGNGAHPQLPRHPNYIWDQLADDRLIASLIVDGHHLPASVVKAMVRAKGPERCVLISDVTGLGGMPPGRYDARELCPVEVLPDGRMVVAGQREILAGAALPITRGVANVMRRAGVDLKTAIDMASLRPAEILGRPGGRLAAGQPADLVQFDLLEDSPEGIRIRATMNSGRWAWRM